jgi:hypothetical protein
MSGQSKRIPRPKGIKFAKKMLSSGNAKLIHPMKLHEAKGPSRSRKNVMLTPDQIQNNLKHKSPWYNAIVDPLRGADVKIPDETGIATSTVQLVQKVTVPTNANGISGLRIIYPYVNNINGVGASGNFQITDPTASEALLTFESVAGVADASTGFTGSEEIYNIARYTRICSMEVSAMPVMASLEDSGEMNTYLSPFNHLGGSPGFPLTRIQEHYGSALIPINSKKAAFARWIPVAIGDRSFKMFQPVYGTSDTPYWELGIVCSGCTTGRDVVFQIVVNYEFIPRYNTVNLVSSAPSPQDSTEEGLVQNWVQDDSPSGSVPISEVTKAPTLGLDRQETGMGSGLGMIADVVKEIGPLLAGVASVIL